MKNGYEGFISKGGGFEGTIEIAMERYSQQQLESKDKEIENLKRELKEANDELRSIAEDEAGADL